MRFSDRIGTAIATAHDMVDHIGAVTAPRHDRDGFCRSLGGESSIAPSVLTCSRDQTNKPDPLLADPPNRGWSAESISLLASFSLECLLFVVPTIFQRIGLRYLAPAGSEG
jgi:hypothetical protein